MAEEWNFWDELPRHRAAGYHNVIMFVIRPIEREIKTRETPRIHS